MNDYIGKLTARTLHTTPIIQPRLSSRFEAMQTGARLGQAHPSIVDRPTLDLEQFTEQGGDSRSESATGLSWQSPAATRPMIDNAYQPLPKTSTVNTILPAAPSRPVFALPAVPHTPKDDRQRELGQHNKRSYLATASEQAAPVLTTSADIRDQRDELATRPAGHAMKAQQRSPQITAPKTPAEPQERDAQHERQQFDLPAPQLTNPTVAAHGEAPLATETKRQPSTALPREQSESYAAQSSPAGSRVLRPAHLLPPGQPPATARVVAQPSTTIAPRQPALSPSVDRLSANETAPAPPTIQVTIGRIEVRATPAPPPKAKPTSAQSTVMSLDEYLRRRNGGGGR